MTTMPDLSPPIVDRPAEGVSTPADPLAFLREVERITNAFDWAAAAEIYADDAALELVTDGAVAWHHGRTAAGQAWRVVLGAGRRRGLVVTKSLVAASETTLVNRWEGTLAGGGRCRGIESWTFGADGLVTEHRAETFLTVRPATSRRARLSLATRAPRVALSFVVAERAARATGDAS